MENILQWHEIGDYHPPEEEVILPSHWMQELIDKTGITDPDTIHYLLAHAHAEDVRKEIEEKRKKINYIKDRGWLKVPKGLNKTELNTLKKRTQETINYYKDKILQAETEVERDWFDLIQDDWIKKKRHIQSILKLHDNFGTNNIQKAKEYPIKLLLNFNSANFTRCIFHDEKTPSMKYYADKNRVHCFSCNKSFDAIDIYQKLNEVEFSVAVKALS